MKKRVALVLNTSTHVETALSLYRSLDLSPHWNPVLVPLSGNVRELFPFLKELNLRFEDEHANPDDFDYALIITAYPRGAEYPPLPQEKHPMVVGFRNRRLLITHRATRPSSFYDHGPAVGLTPFCANQGLDFLYLCENPALESLTPSLTDKPVRFLVQGKFGYKHRDLDLLQIWLKKHTGPAQILLLGEGAAKIALSLSDERVNKFDKVSEPTFYKVAATAHFILPLINRTTRQGSYLCERFSTSYSLAFASERPVIASDDLASIYSVPTLAYSDVDSFCNHMNDCLNMTDAAYRHLIAPYTIIKQEFRKHNLAVLEKYLPIH
jgi:hypothetical protein